MLRERNREGISVRWEGGSDPKREGQSQVGRMFQAEGVVGVRERPAARESGTCLGERGAGWGTGGLVGNSGDLRVFLKGVGTDEGYLNRDHASSDLHL